MRLALSLGLILGTIAAIRGEVTSFTTTGNPLFEGADPDVLVHGNLFWVYPTGGGTASGPAFFAFSSTDLKSWNRHGPVFEFRNVSWLLDDGAPRRFAWAPGILEHNQRFYLYYSAGPNTPKPSRIGVAVADKPEGPFIDSGHVLIDGAKGFEAIDAKPFRVPGTDQFLLYCGGSAGAKLRVFELDASLTRVAREIPVENPQHFTEGAFIHERHGLFYLSYSHGNYRDATYSVHYCTARTATGPWSYEGIILSSDSRHLGPGHHSIVQHPLTKGWLMFYHRWNDAARTGKIPPARSVCVEALEYDAAGKIKPVRMSNATD